VTIGRMADASADLVSAFLGQGRSASSKVKTLNIY
jgi:hypothetical protein